MNRKQKLLRRKINIFCKLYDDIALDYKREVFTSIYEFAHLQQEDSEDQQFEVLTQQERRLIWNKFITDANKAEKAKIQEEQEIYQNLNKETKLKIESDENAKKMLMIIKQKFLTYQQRLRQDAFQIWKRKTSFTSKTAKYVGIAGNVLIINEQERIQRLKDLLRAKQQELQDLKDKTLSIEDTGKLEFNERKSVRTLTIKKLALKNIIEVIKTRGLKIPFYLLKVNAEFKRKKALMFQQLPRPRLRQWWEKLLEKEYKHLYEQAELQMKLVPEIYKDIYVRVIEHKRMGDIIKIQRYFRKRILQHWLEDHNLENGQILEKGQSSIQSNKRLVKVDMSFLDQRRKERGEVECSLF